MFFGSCKTSRPGAKEYWGHHPLTGKAHSSGPPIPGQESLFHGEYQFPIDKNFFGFRSEFKRIPRPEGEVGVLAGVDGSHSIVDAQNFGRVDGDHLERGLIRHAVVAYNRRLLDVVALFDYRTIRVQADQD